MKLQDKGSTGVNDEVDSTGSSSTSGSNEKAAPLLLLQEFALNTLLVRRFSLLFLLSFSFRVICWFSIICER